MIDSLSASLDALRIDRPTAAPASRHRAWVWGGALALVTAAVLAAVEVRTLRPPLVHVALVERAASSEPAVDLTATGYLTAQRVAHLGAPVVGRVARVYVREGDSVKASQALFELDDVSRRASVAALRAHALAGKARADVARSQIAELKEQIDRATLLVAHDALPVAEVDDLKLRLATQQSSLSAADADAQAAFADVDAAASVFRDYVVRAPFDGIATSKPASVGDSVGPGTPLVELIDPSSMLLEADVPEARMGIVHSGTPCEVVLDAFPDQPLTGSVVGFGPRIERAKATGTVRVRLEGNAPLILPDMSARVRFLKAPRPALSPVAKPIIPPAAIVRRGGHDVVFVIEGEHVRAVAVTSEGLAAGTRVVLSPSADLTDGERIRTEESAHD